jgi:methionine-gamma-lyase
LRGCRGAVSTGRLHEPDSMCGCALNLQLRGLKTLPLRMARHCESAARIALHLQKHPAVASVSYCGLPGHPDHDLATRTFTKGRGYGGMLAFEVCRTLPPPPPVTP